MVKQNKKPSSLLNQHETNWTEECKVYNLFLETSSDDSLKMLKKTNHKFFNQNKITKKTKTNDKEKKKDLINQSSSDQNTENVILPFSVKEIYDKQLKLNLFGDPDNPEYIEHINNPMEMKQYKNMTLNTSNGFKKINIENISVNCSKNSNSEQTIIDDQSLDFDIADHDRIEYMKKYGSIENQELLDKIEENPFLSEKDCYHHVPTNLDDAWPKNKGLPCFLCGYVFDHEPIAVPVYNHINYSKRPVLKGNMCSIQCAKQWINEQNSFYIGYQLTVFNFIIQKRYGIQSQYIDPAPPSSILLHKGGIMSIEEYRSMFLPSAEIHVHPERYKNLSIDQRSKTFIEEIPIHCMSHFNIWSTINRYNPENPFKLFFLSVDTTKRNQIIKDSFKNLSIYKDFMNEKQKNNDSNKK